MKKTLISLLAVCAMSGAAFAAPDYRSLVTIPSGQTAVTQAVFAAMGVLPNTVVRLDSYAVGANASITNLSIAVSIVGATYTNTIPAVTAAAATANTPAAITVKQAVGTADYFIVTTAGATNAVATQVYIDLMP